ncbi:DUF3168 domain-containing protein [Xanthomonas sp. PPL568]|uniref:tail completion protein gp17 n=1 Tax=Xanthomonas indica TaxID=2912242 RepID=UPI001F5A26FD|nr:DUF3168 domain-containing protein [Xanthomonas indica]MCI2243278.1 DUF3168 domain-containing protein [Xanthomonas indica]
MTLDEKLVAAMNAVTSAVFAAPAKNPPSLYATYQRTSGRRHGTLNSGLGAERATFQIDVWGPAKGSTRFLADQLKDQLPRTLKVGDLTDNPDDYEGGTGLHRASFDVVVWA